MKDRFGNACPGIHSVGRVRNCRGAARLETPPSRGAEVLKREPWLWSVITHRGLPL